MNTGRIPGLLLSFLAGGAAVFAANRCSENPSVHAAEQKPAAVDQGGSSEVRKQELEMQAGVKRATQEMLVRDEYLVEIGAKKKRLDPFGVRLIDTNGDVLTGALEEAGIDPAEKENIQRLVDETRSRAKQLLISKAALERLDDPTSDHPKYVIKVESDADQGNQILSTLEANFSQKYGPQKATKLMSLIDDSKMLGAFGRQNQRLEVVYFEPRNTWNVIWTYSNPRSGGKISSGTSMLPRFSEAGILDGGWIKEVIGDDLNE